jgi:amino acid transporter
LFSSTHFLDIRKSPDWGLYVSTLLWAYNGWDSLGCIAGEVKNPHSTYVRGTLLALLLITITYIFPVFTASQVRLRCVASWI